MSGFSGPYTFDQIEEPILVLVISLLDACNVCNFCINLYCISTFCCVQGYCVNNRQTDRKLGLVRNFKKRWPRIKRHLNDRNVDGQTTLS